MPSYGGGDTRPPIQDGTVNRALVVIDVQQEYVSGELPIAFPPLATSLTAIGRAIDAAHEHGVPVVLVRQVAPEGSPIFAVDGPGFALHPAVADRPHDLVVDKRLPSALSGTGLDEWLRGRGVDTVTLAGYMTQNCVDATARHALHAGYRVEVLSDATGAPHYANEAGEVTAAELHTATLVALHARFAAVATTDAWADALDRGEPLPGSSVLASARAGGARAEGDTGRA